MNSHGEAEGRKTTSAVLAITLVILFGAGCERWPWESATESAPATSQGSPTSAATSSGPSQPAGVVMPDQERVAMVNQTAISTTDIELATLELKRFVQASGQGWTPLPAQDLPDQLDLGDVMRNLEESELKAQDARARGLDRKTEIRRRFAYLERGFYAQEWDRWQREQAAPTEEAVHQFYEQNKVGFLDPERIRVRQIVTETREQAEAIRSRVVQGEGFAQLAREVSVGAGKEQGGDIGWHLRAIDKERLRLIGATPTEELFFPQLEPVAFALEEQGQVSQPVKGPDGRSFVVQLEERKPARQQTELEVHDTIKELLTLQRMQQHLEELRGKAKVEEFPERLSEVQQ